MSSKRKMLYAAIVYCVIIGLIYTVLSILALLARGCLLGVESSPFIYMLYLLYFRVEKCEPNITWKHLSLENGPIVGWPSETQAVQRTFILSISYLVLHLALIATSAIAFFGIRMSCVGRKSYVFFLAPWIISLIAVIVCDCFATVYYSIDAVSAMKIDGLVQLLGIYDGDMEKIYENFRHLSLMVRYIPIILMVLVTSKFVAFTVINAIWTASITRNSWILTKEFDDKSKSQNYQNAIMANDNPAFEDENSHKAQPNLTALANQEAPSSQRGSLIEQQQLPAEETPELRYNDTSRSTDYVYPHQIYAKSSKQKSKTKSKAPDPKTQELDFKIKRPILDVQSLSQSRPDSRESSRSPPPPVLYQNSLDPEIEDRLRRFKESNGMAVKTAFAYESRPKESPYASINVVGAKEPKPRPTLPPKPINNNKFYLQSTGHEEPVQFRPTDGKMNNVERSSSNLKAPEALRGQLPWSYFKMGQENMPRRVLAHTEDEVPELPKPDYRNSQMQRRRNLSGSDNDHSWQYQHY